MIVFHSSFTANITEFLPLTHFGTYEAAHENMKRSREKKQYNGTGYIYKASVASTGKLISIQDPRSPRPLALVNSLAISGFFNPSGDYEANCKASFQIRTEQVELMDIDEPEISLGDKELYRSCRYHLANFLTSQGVKMISYTNEVEDEGSTSFIVVDPTVLTNTTCISTHLKGES